MIVPPPSSPKYPSPAGPRRPPTPTLFSQGGGKVGYPLPHPHPGPRARFAAKADPHVSCLSICSCCTTQSAIVARKMSMSVKQDVICCMCNTPAYLMDRLDMDGKWYHNWWVAPLPPPLNRYVTTLLCCNSAKGELNHACSPHPCADAGASNASSAIQSCPSTPATTASRTVR